MMFGLIQFVESVRDLNLLLVLKGIYITWNVQIVFVFLKFGKCHDREILRCFLRFRADAEQICCGLLNECYFAVELVFDLGLALVSLFLELLQRLHLGLEFSKAGDIGSFRCRGSNSKL